MYMCAGFVAIVAASLGKIAGKSRSNGQSERDYTVPAVYKIARIYHKYRFFPIIPALLYRYTLYRYKMTYTGTP
jgi:hypothetical protein